jgi:hypothetical protein
MGGKTYNSAGLPVGGGLGAAQGPQHREGGGKVLERVRLRPSSCSAKSS